MLVKFKFLMGTLLLCNMAAFAGVTITAPKSGSTVGSSVQFIASATSDAGKPISSMMIYVDNKADYTTYSSSLNKTLTLGSGSHIAVIKSWDSAGHVYTKSVSFTVSGSYTPPSGGNTITAIQAMSNWGSCSDCAGKGGNGPIAPYSMTEHQSSPSMTGNSTRFWIGGTTPYSDALWWKGVPASPSAHHFTYDLYFYIQNPSASEALEFDLNVAYNGRYYVFGNQCNPKSSHTWDVYDAPAGHWDSTGVACPTFPAYKWNHVSIAMERTADSRLHYVSITYNGVTHYINRYIASRASSSGNWVSVDFQMDGDSKQTDYSVWLDKVNLSYY
jgi:hypothetical protein